MYRNRDQLYTVLLQPNDNILIVTSYLLNSHTAFAAEIYRIIDMVPVKCPLKILAVGNQASCITCCKLSLAPGRTNIVFRSRTDQCGIFPVAIEVDLDLSFTPTAIPVLRIRSSPTWAVYCRYIQTHWQASVIPILFPLSRSCHRKRVTGPLL